MSLTVMEYLSELIHAQMEYKEPKNIPDGIVLEELEEIAHRNHMDYLILGALLKTDLPETDKERIRPYMIQSTMRTLAQVYCRKQLEQHLEEAGIYHLLLKGAVLKGLYPSPEMREMSDIDVMIYDENLSKAKEVVEAMGFQLLESVKHHDIYAKPPYLILELHCALYDKNVDKIQFEYFDSKRTAIPIEGKQYALQFQVEDFYVYLIAHMAKHFYETGCGIRNILDVYLYRQLYEATWKEEYIQKELETCGLITFDRRIHTLSQVWLGGKEADPFSKELFQYMLDCGIYGKSENGIWGQFAKKNQRKSKNFQAHAKRWYYFPPLSYMKNDYPWLNKQPYLLIVAWGIRAVHGLFSKEGREKRKMLLRIKSEEVNTIYDIYEGMDLDFNK